MASVISQSVVAFSGEGAGEGPLSWGQQEMWLSMLRYGHAMPVGGIKPLDPGSSIEEISDELRYLMSRYQVMRTRLRFEPDGTARQVVSASGEIMLEIIEVDGDDAAKTAEVTEIRYRETPFDYAVEWPVRMAVIQKHGVLTHMVVIMQHLAMDAYSAQIMMTEVASRRQEPITGMQPLEQARWQRSAAGIRQNEMALKHAESILRTMPPPFPSGPGEPCQPRHWEGNLRSPALHLAVQALAVRTEADSASVLLTVYAIAVARRSGSSPVVVRSLASNRFRRGLSDVVCPLTHTGLCLLDVGSVTFTEALRRTQRAALLAHKHAYYDPGDVNAIASRITKLRGPEFVADSFFNDRRVTTKQAVPMVEPAPESIREALARTSFDWAAAKDTTSTRLFIQVEDIPDTIVLNMYADTHYLSLVDAEALLREMEAVAVEEATGSAA